LLRMARNWQANKQPSQARKYLRQIIAQYPTTDQAETAKRLLRDLK
ncbi:tetratricopeptide repeat protein, partial [bacterium]|nr:tetratricopeptide repeat protein [bacterium]